MTTIARLTLAASVLVLLSGTARAERTALLSVGQANRAAATYTEQVKRCYFRHALIEPSASGHVRIDLDVRSSGAVGRVRVVAPGLARRHFERCIVTNALTWRFPASREPTEVRMPFRFHVPVRISSTTGAQRPPSRP